MAWKNYGCFLSHCNHVKQAHMVKNGVFNEATEFLK